MMDGALGEVALVAVEPESETGGSQDAGVPSPSETEGESQP